MRRFEQRWGLGACVALGLAACEASEEAGDAGAGGGTGGAVAGGSGGAVAGGSGGSPVGGSGGSPVGGSGGSPVGGQISGGTGGVGGMSLGGSGGSGGVLVGGSGGSGGSGGVSVGGSGGEPVGGSGGSGGEPVGGNGGGSDGGSGGATMPCVGENPEGCVNAGCPEGQFCEFNVDACVSSGCVCDEAAGQWNCLPDCGGGLCMPLPSDTNWYLTCGDPVCRGHQPDPNIPPCDAAMMAGGACVNPGALCDPGDDCNARLLCADSDPRQQPGGCPISKRSFKEDIRYLPTAEVDARAEALLAVKLAEYRYRTEAEGGVPHLGFIIDDGVPTGALRPSKDQVDLYGYTTLAVAAVQAQARQIEMLRAELDSLRAQVAAQAAQCVVTSSAP